MKKLLFLFIIIFITQHVVAQVLFGEQQIIAGQTLGANSVYACDIDGNGDNDVLSASFWNNKIAWYENIFSIIEQPVNQNAMIDLSSFENGIYIIKIQTNKEIFTTKIVKE